MTIANAKEEDYTSTHTIEDVEVVWVCTVCDDGEMADIFEPEDGSDRDTPDWDKYGFWKDIKVGAKMRWYISKVKDDSEYLYRDAFKLSFKLWKWTTEIEWGRPNEKDAFTYVFCDPGYLGPDVKLLMPYDYTPPSITNDKHSVFFDKYIEIDYDIYYTDLDDLSTYKYFFHYYDFGIPLWLPTPTDDYLENMEFKDNYKIHDFTLEGEIEEDSFRFGDYKLPNEDFQYIATYNEQGFMSNFQVINKKKQIVCEFALQTINFSSDSINLIKLSSYGLMLICFAFCSLKKIHLNNYRKNFRSLNYNFKSIKESIIK